MDEIGRGTATYDGLAIAWSTLEYLHDVNKCRTLLDALPRIDTSSRKNWHSYDAMRCRFVNGRDGVFLHQVIAGAAIGLMVFRWRG